MNDDMKMKTIKVWPETHKALTHIKTARGKRTLSETIQDLIELAEREDGIFR